MATKSKEVKKKLLNKITFHITEMPGCCGIGVANGFSADAGAGRWVYRGGRDRFIPQKGKFDTPEEQARNCLDRILKHSWDKDNSYSVSDGNYSCVYVNLISNYSEREDQPDEKRMQFPALQDLLIAEGWVINNVFINPNHGNEITVFSKYFPDRDKNLDEYYDDNEDDDDAWDEDNDDDDE
jgi:hypothetical protein